MAGQKMNEPITRLLNQSQAAERLGHQILRDAVAAGWIAPRAQKKGKTARKAAKIIFALSDVEDVEDRILGGEYPESVS